MPAFGESMLERVRYDGASAQLGIEVGSQRRFVLFLRGGASYVDGSLGPVGGEVDGGASFSASEPRLRGAIPSAKLGFVLWLG